VHDSGRSESIGLDVGAAEDRDVLDDVPGRLPSPRRRYLGLRCRPAPSPRAPGFAMAVVSIAAFAVLMYLGE
jgi:hypothetical protein